MTLVFLLVLAGIWGGLYLAARKLTTVSFMPEAIAASGLLALATAGFFWQIIFTSNSWMPAGGGDLAPFLYPNYHFAAQHLRQGDVPLWNPHLYSGAPFAADIQSGLFYPINLLVFLLAPALTYGWLEFLAVFHFWLAGTTMYLCLRLLYPPTDKTTPQIPPLPAFAGAIAFEFSDLFIVHFGNLNMIAVAAWLPLVFLLFHRSLLHRSLGLAAAAGAALAIATLAGHIQITLFILLTLGLYALWKIIINYELSITNYQISNSNEIDEATTTEKPRITDHAARSPHHPTRPTPRSSFIAPHFSRITHHTSRLFPIPALLTTLLITIGLSALLLFPAYEMSRHTPRAELPYEEAARFSLHPVQMVGLLVPNYFGRDPALHWGPWERVETGYIGILTLLLAVIGLLLHPTRLKIFFGGLALVALLLAMGGYSLLHGWLYAVAPGFDQLRAPARFILLLDFSLAALAALGLAHLLAPFDARSHRLLPKLLKPLTWGLGGLIVVAGPLSYFALLVTQDRNPAIFNRAAAAAAGVATFALFAIAALVLLHLIHSRWLREYSAGLAAIILISLDLFTLGYNVDVGHTNPVTGFDHPEAIAFLKNDPHHFRIEVTTDVWHAWQPNAALLNGLYDAWGLYNPLTLADTTLYWSGAPPRSSGRYNFLGIKYIIASKAGAPADGNIVPIFDADPQINIYLNQDALPRLLFVGHSQVVPDHDAAWEAIRAEDFDPAQTVILEGGQVLAPDGDPNSRLTLLEYGIETVTVAVETDQPGYLVLADAYYPGWQATLDGRPVPIERANYAFRAVHVPPGEHTIRFVFDPLIWKVGLAISGITLLGLIGWAGWRGQSFRRSSIVSSQVRSN